MTAAGATQAEIPMHVQRLFRKFPYHEHPQGASILDGVRFFSMAQEETGLGYGMRLVGETDCGKTTLCIEVVRRCPPYKLEGGWNYPVLFVSFRERSKLVDVYQGILEALGDPMAEVGTVGEKKARCMQLLREAGVKLLIFDEPHHLTASASDGSRVGLAELAKVLLLAGINVMFAGVRSIDVLTRQSPELARRFPSRFELMPYRLSSPEELTVLRNFCDAMGEHAGGLEATALGTDDTFFTPLAATSAGAIGVIASLTKLAAVEAKLRGARRLALEHFSAIWDAYISETDESHVQHLARKGKCLRNLFKDPAGTLEVFGQVAQAHNAYV